MADIVRQAQVIKNIISLVKNEIKCDVYSDEVKEDFRKPCFFIAATSVMTPQSVNWLQKELTVTLTYYAKASEKNEIHYMDIVDRIQLLFQVGIQVNDRYLKIDSVEDDRVGEEDDILQITITIPYLERTTGTDTTADLIEEVDMDITNGQQEHDSGNIDKDYVGIGGNENG